MPDLKFPQRRLDANGKWIVYMHTVPPVDPVFARQREIDQHQQTLSSTWPDGFPAYNAEERAFAEQRLQELGITEEEASDER